MNGRRIGFLIGAVAAAATSAARSQDTTALAAGAHIRITAPSLGWDGKTADLAGVHGDTLLLRRAPILFFPRSPTPVPLGAVTALEVSRNHFAHVAAEFLGGMAGAFAGVRVGVGLNTCRPASGLDFSCLGSGIATGLLGGAVGEWLGVLIGAAIVPERWALVGLPRPRVSVAPLPSGRLAVGLSLPF